MTFWSDLADRCRAQRSLVCVGLDPRPERTPPGRATVTDFCKGVIDASADAACAFKPNIAFFEALGLDGLHALEDVLAHIGGAVPVILDAKRNDIASTASAYAVAAFERWGVDALTVTPYLGRDGVTPFTAYADRGVFLLCKTSNPSAAELQDWSQDGVPLYRRVAELAREWAEGGEIGLVIGATYPEAIARIRRDAPNTWFLVPGVGAQGGDLEAVLRAGLRPDGSGLVINASRSIIYADDPRAAAFALRDRINACAESLAEDNRPTQAPTATPCKSPSHPATGALATGALAADLRRVAIALFEAGCVRFGEFTLHSGATSPIYVDLRRLVTYPRVMTLVAEVYAWLLQNLTYDRIAAIPYAALPIGTAVALHTGDPLIYPRREAKAYGTRRQIEGEFHAGETAVLLDDLISSGGSKLEAIGPLQEAGLQIRDVVVLIDREQGGRQDLEAQGYALHAALTLRELVGALAEEGRISHEDAEAVFAYLAS